MEHPTLPSGTRREDYNEKLLYYREEEIQVPNDHYVYSRAYRKTEGSVWSSLHTGLV